MEILQANGITTQTCPILSLKMTKLFHITKHTSLSKSKSLKRKLVQYVSNKLLDQSIAVTIQHHLSVTVHSPSPTSPATVHNGAIIHSTLNEHGEADYAIWHQCIKYNFMQYPSCILLCSCCHYVIFILRYLECL